MSSDDKGRAIRGQKRNFSFEAHTNETVAQPAKEEGLAGSSGTGFDITALVHEFERIHGVENDEKLSDETASQQKADDSSRYFNDDLNNNVESSIGEQFLNRGSYIPFLPVSTEDVKGLQTPDLKGLQPPDLKNLQPVDLQVTNLDQTVDQREMKKILFQLFSGSVSVLNVSVFFQSDGNMAASVRVASPQDAQVAISLLHRKKLGYKRILISNSQVHNFNPNMLRSKVGAILKEVPNGRLQLFKFREMYEKRYHEPIGVSDLYKMKDVVNITEDGNASGRMIQLQPTWYSQCQQMGAMTPIEFDPNASLNVISRPSNGMVLYSAQPSLTPPVLDSAFCKIHVKESVDTKVGWAEKENGTLLPNVNIPLSVLGPNMKQLIQSHGEALPLASLAICYAATFPPGFTVDNEEGVPLEHLVTCLRGISIQQSVSGVKQLILVGVPAPHQGIIGTTFTGRNEEGKISSVFSHYRQLSGSSIGSSASSTASSSITNLTTFGLQNQVPGGGAAAPLENQLAHFSRELVELLKLSPGCRMAFHKFIPAFHHQFGRQCRVADYGYTKLKDLFEALPNVVQIMGEGSRAVITLAHRAQVKRFTSDLQKVLRSQPNKEISVLDLPLCFEKSTNRPFKISDYGVCDLEDILNEVSETSVVLSGSGDDLVISMPKREQTQSEVMKTQQFAHECIELLRHAPDCRLDFNKFIPAYHHHFGRQCRVSDYGFLKLIELFEAIPNTVEITENANGERLLQLTDMERLTVLADQITALIMHKNNQMNIQLNNNNNMPNKFIPSQSLKIEDLDEAYRNQFGYQLRPDTYGENTILELLSKLNRSLRVEKDDKGVAYVRLIDRSHIKAMANQVRDILSADPDGKMKVDEFLKLYETEHGSPPDLSQMKSDLLDWVEFYEESPNVDHAENSGESITAMASGNNSETKATDAGDSVKVPEVEVTDADQVQERYIKLRPLQLCVVKIQNLLKHHGDKILMSEFEAAFAEKFKTALCPGQYGFPSLMALIQSPVMAEEHFLIRGSGARRMIWFLRDGGGPTFPVTSSYPASNPGRGPAKDLGSQNYSFHERVTSAVDNFTSQQRYPAYRGETMRYGQAPARNWPSNTGPISRGATANQFPRAIRGSQHQTIGNHNRFVYPPPMQSPFMGYPYGSNVVGQQQDFNTGYWGSLARFGIFPNANSGSGHNGNSSMEPSGGYQQNIQNGSNCGRSLSGGLVPPPPLQRLSPSVGSPIHQGLSSLLPTPHSPSPMMPGPGTSPFTFPPTYWPNNGNSPGSFKSFM